MATKIRKNKAKDRAVKAKFTGSSTVTVDRSRRCVDGQHRLRTLRKRVDIGETKVNLHGALHMNVPIDKIKIDRAYTNPHINQRFVDEIVHAFSLNKFCSLLVGDRGAAGLYCVDGQDRLLALRQRNASGVLPRIDTVPCNVFKSRGPLHEAQVFSQTSVLYAKGAKGR